MRVDQSRRRGELLEVLHQDNHEGLATKWGDACGHFIEDDTQRVQVAALVAHKPLRLFG